MLRQEQLSPIGRDRAVDAARRRLFEALREARPKPNGARRVFFFWPKSRD
jgi:hypothetical protein